MNTLKNVVFKIDFLSASVKIIKDIQKKLEVPC